MSARRPWPAEVRERARALHAQGEGPTAIAQTLTVPMGTIRLWLYDPDGARARARRESYRGTCRRCGAATHGSAGPDAAPEFCGHCSPVVVHTKWSRESIADAIREFARRYKRPPAATDFNPAQARAFGHDGRADRFEEDGCYPSSNIVRRHFGTWNAAVEAAGFEPRGAGGAHLTDAERAAA